MTLYILRHGESEWNQKNKFTGWTDVSLSKTGQQESLTAGLLLKSIRFDYILTSKLSRTIETAKIITSNLQQDTVNFCSASDLNERDYGDLTGKNKDEICIEYGEDKLKLWRRSYNVSPPNGESLADVKKRVGDFFDMNILHLLKSNSNVLIVAHGNSLRALLVHLDIFSETEIETFEISTCVPIIVNLNTKTLQYINQYKLIGTQIIDSRGIPTIEVACFDTINKKFIGKGSSPSGASCGSTEVLELRDNIKNYYFGKSVKKCIANLSLINNNIMFNDKTILDLKYIDQQLVDLDKTEMKTLLGGNTTTAVSFCMADVASKKTNMEMFEYISNTYNINKNTYTLNMTFASLPTPFVNIINGGKHSVTGELQIQEFMIFPNETFNIHKKIQIICEVYNSLQKLLVAKYGNHAKSIGDEGGFCPPIYTSEEALTVIETAIRLANYIPGIDVFMALDCAASEFYNEQTEVYEVEKNLFLNNIDLISYYENLIKNHPALKSIEDAFHEKDYEAWELFTKQFSDKIMIVGDDLFTTNKKLICYGIDNNLANTLLLKVNQIGTISEAIEGAALMFKQGNNVIVSHRSGETNHAYIVDIAVGICAKYLKIGSPCRGERVAKFNRLLEIDMYLTNVVNNL
jgi:enolase